MGLMLKESFSYLPGEPYHNKRFEKYLDTSDQWIQERTGIVHRHFSDKSMEEMIARLSKIIEAKDIDTRNIKLVLVATCTSSHQIPTLASIVCGYLGLNEDVLALDINQACSGFVSGLSLAEKYLDVGDEALVIGVEKFSDILDYDDRSTAVLFGDGGAGVLVEKNRDLAIFNHGTISDSSVLCRDIDTNVLTMNGKEVYRFVVRDIAQKLEDFLSTNSIDKDEVLFISHQANKRIIEALANRLKVNINQLPTNIEKTGNISSASIPLLLDEVIKNYDLKRGEKIVLVAFGAGMSWAFGYLTY